MMLNAYVTVYVPTTPRAMSRARLERLIEKEAPALGRYAWAATHHGIGCLRVSERFAADYRESMQHTIGLLRDMGYAYRIDETAAAFKAAWQRR